MGGIFSFLVQQKPKPRKPRKASNKEIVNSIPKRLKVWETYIGLEKGKVKCPLCQENDMVQGNSHSWHVCHVKAKAEQGSNQISNLRPCCPHCNLHMRTMDMKDYCHMYCPEAIPRLGL